MQEIDSFQKLAMTPDERAALPRTKKKGFQQAPRENKSLDQNLFDRIDLGLPEDGAGKKKRAKPVDHNPRMRKILEEKGYAATKKETWRTFPSGFSCKVDYHGLWDWEGTKYGVPPIYLQGVTGDHGMKTHLREMTSDKKALDNRKAKIDNLRWHIAQGHYCAFAVFDKQDNGRWAHRIVRITTAMIDETVSRKRKPKAK